MTVDATTLRKLAALGLDDKQMAGVLDILADGLEREEARKAAQRERTRRARAKSVTLQSHDGNSDDTRGRVTRVEDKTSTQKIEPQEQKEGAKRATRLPSDAALPDDWRREARELGVPEPRIDLEWATMRDWSQSAHAGAKRDWRAAWRNWCRRVARDLPKSQGPPGKVPQLADVFQFIGRRENERQEREDSGGIRPALPHVPAVGSR